MRSGYLTALCVCLCLLLAACGGDDYHYPSVRMEFLTATAGADGALQLVLADDGAVCPVWEDRSHTRLEAGEKVRIVSNYETVFNAAGEAGVRLYAVMKAIAPQPKPAAEFEEGIHTAPASVQSIWMGYDYLNILLSVSQPGKHQLHFIEEEVGELQPDGTLAVKLMLYHAVQEEATDYEKRAYLSVPLRQYVTEGVRRVNVQFSLHSDQAFDEPYEKPDSQVGGVMTYNFEYIPK